MKKIIFLLLVTVILAAGCSRSGDDTLRVGMDLRFFPFTGMDKSGMPSGVEVDIAQALAEYLDKDVEIVNTEFSILIPALQSGEIDIIIGSLTITEDREKTVDFSNPYFYEKIVALVNKDFAQANNINDSMPVEDFFGIEDTRFIGITGSVAVSIPQSYGYNVQNVTTEAVAEREITTGSADVLVGAYTLYGMNNTNKKTTVMYKKAIEASKTGMAVKDGSNELLEKVNSFIAQMETSGLNDRLRNDWNTEIGRKLFDDEMTLDYYLEID